MWNRIIVEMLSHVSSQHAMLSRDKRLSLDTRNQSGLQENVFGNPFSTFDSPRDHPQRIQLDDVQRSREAVKEARRTKTIHTREDRQKSRHNSNADICNKTVDCEFYNAGGIAAELHGRTAKTANIGVAIKNHSGVKTCRVAEIRAPQLS